MWLFNGSHPPSRKQDPTMCQSSTVPPLAVELILDILDLVAHDEYRTNGKPTSLLNCATVCKSWAPITQARLFRTVTLETLRQSTHFLSAVSAHTAKASFLRESVRSLEVLVSDEEDGRVITQFAFANILKLCPNVTDLRLFYFCLRPLDWNTLDILRSVPAPISLSLRCAQDPSPLWDLLTIWPTIQHLEVVSWEMPSITTTKIPNGTWAPYEVRWLDESDSGEDSLPRLLRPGSLRILQLLKTPSDEFFDALMRTHGPYLRSLRLRGITDQVASSLANCTSLEEFTYLQVPSAEVLDSVSPGLEHLQFQNGTNRHSSIRPVLDYVRNRATRLRVVTYNSCGSTLDVESRELADVCRKRGIELKCFADNSPIEEKEPLMRPARFPRPVPTGRRRLVVINDKTFNPASAGPSSSCPPPSPIAYAPSPPPSARKSAYRGRRGSSPEGFYGLKLGL